LTRTIYELNEQLMVADEFAHSPQGLAIAAKAMPEGAIRPTLGFVFNCRYGHIGRLRSQAGVEKRGEEPICVEKTSSVREPLPS